MRILKIILLLVIFFFIGLYICSTDMSQVTAALQKVGINFIWLLLVTFLSYLCGAIAWRHSMGTEGKKISIGRLFIVRHIGETVGLVNPTSVVGGEAMKIYLLNQSGIDRKVTITSILLSRAIMITTQLLMFVVSAVSMMVVYQQYPTLPGDVHLSWWLLCAIAVLITIFTIKKWIVKPLTKTKWWRIGKVQTSKLQLKFTQLQYQFKANLVSNKKGLLLCTVFTIIHWFLGSAEFFLILRLLGIDISLIQSLFVDMGVIFFKSAGAFIPAQLGIEEYGNKVMLAAIGISAASVWVTASVLKRARQLFWIIFGLLAWFIFYNKWSNRSAILHGNTVC